MPACKPVLSPLFHLSAMLLIASTPPARAATAGFRYWKVADTSQTPRTLSATGLYTSITGKQKTLLPNAWHFDVNTALWSDDAKKKRWVLLKPGASIGFKEMDDYWDYPDSTVFIKQFAIDTVTGDSTTRVLWETRLLINYKEIIDSAKGARADVWYGFSYKWDADQKDARLVQTQYDGMQDSIRIWPQGRGKPSRMKKWIFPSQAECNRCHRSDAYDTLHARSVLGFFTAQLNRPHPDSASVNQLEYFFAKKVLKGTRPADWSASPRWHPIDDNSASVDVRARSYIAANCSGCHGTRGNAFGAADHCYLNYDFFRMTPQMEFRNHNTSSFGLEDSLPFFYPVTDRINNPFGSDSLKIQPALVVPGYPEKSVLLFRQLSRRTAPGVYDPDRNQMPPLASFEVNTAATDLLARWIREMPPLPPDTSAIAVRRLGGGRSPIASLRDGRLTLSPEAIRSGARISMVGLNGREIRLFRLAEGIYAVRQDLPKGLYLIRIGKQTLLRSLM